MLQVQKDTRRIQEKRSDPRYAIYTLDNNTALLSTGHERGNIGQVLLAIPSWHTAMQGSVMPVKSESKKGCAKIGWYLLEHGIRENSSAI